MCKAALPGTEDSGLQTVCQEGKNALYRFNPAVTDLLFQFTPGRSEFTRQGIAAITNRMMEFPGVREHYLDSGIRGAILSVRGCALKARAAGSPTEVFYWCVYRAV
jgi:hypothetical protein